MGEFGPNRMRRRGEEEEDRAGAKHYQDAGSYTQLTLPTIA